MLPMSPGWTKRHLVAEDRSSPNSQNVSLCFAYVLAATDGRIEVAERPFARAFAPIRVAPPPPRRRSKARGTAKPNREKAK